MSVRSKPSKTAHDGWWTVATMATFIALATSERKRVMEAAAAESRPEVGSSSTISAGPCTDGEHRVRGRLLVTYDAILSSHVRGTLAKESASESRRCCPPLSPRTSVEPARVSAHLRTAKRTDDQELCVACGVACVVWRVRARGEARRVEQPRHQRRLPHE